MLGAMDLTKYITSVPWVALAIMGVGLLVAFHELGHHLAALWTGMRVRRFSIGFGKPLWTYERNGVEYTLGRLPLGGFVDIVGMNPLEEGVEADPNAYHNKPRWQRAVVVAAGPLFNYALAWVLLVLLFWLGGMRHNQEFVVSDVAPGSAAAAAGVLSGDVIVSVAGKVLEDDHAFQTTVAGSGGSALSLEVRRGVDVLQMAPVPAGAPGSGLLGIRFKGRPVGEARNYALGQAMSRATRGIVVQSTMILGSLAHLFEAKKPLDNLGGPPEIVRQLTDAAQRSMRDLLLMLAALSIMLGLMNLLPIPGLDGSKLMFLGAEMVARRGLPRRFNAYVQGVGTLVLLGLVAVVSVNDLLKKSPKPEEQAKSAPAAQVEPGPNVDLPAAPHASGASGVAGTPGSSSGAPPSPQPGAAP